MRNKENGANEGTIWGREGRDFMCPQVLAYWTLLFENVLDSQTRRHAKSVKIENGPTFPNLAPLIIKALSCSGWIAVETMIISPLLLPAILMTSSDTRFDNELANHDAQSGPDPHKFDPTVLRNRIEGRSCHTLTGPSVPDLGILLGWHFLFLRRNLLQSRKQTCQRAW